MDEINKEKEEEEAKMKEAAEFRQAQDYKKLLIKVGQEEGADCGMSNKPSQKCKPGLYCKSRPDIWSKSGDLIGQPGRCTKCSLREGGCIYWWDKTSCPENYALVENPTLGQNNANAPFKHSVGECLPMCYATPNDQGLPRLEDTWKYTCQGIDGNTDEASCCYDSDTSKYTCCAQGCGKGYSGCKK